MAKKSSAVFSCTECGAQASKWIGRCPECHAWNSYVEESADDTPKRTTSLSSNSPVAIDSVGFDDVPRISTDLPNLDRVLGGGIVPGGVTLIGGEPGIGKSTLLLQVAAKLARLGNVLYVSGEESTRQIALRARRLGTVAPSISLYSETCIEKIVAQIEKIHPVAVVVDSIQTAFTATNDSAPGSIGQVRDSAGILMTAAKRLTVPIFLIGHITKEGTIAGPKTLEHIVDTVLYFEGDKFRHGRLIRAFKNRFGPVNEVAIYEMHDSGLQEVENPSAALLAQRSGAPGSAIVAALEGTRPLLIEVQALVTPTKFPAPRRTAIGIDNNRLSLLVAVLEKRSGANLQSHDVFINIAGGLEFDEPAIDLGVIAALVSSHRNRAIPWDVAIFGEVGLLGEIRTVSQADLRAREAAALGFRRVAVPAGNAREIQSDVEVVGVRTIEDFLQTVVADDRGGGTSAASPRSSHQ